MGAFVSEDPARDGFNWYVYCSGNPVNFWDPWGLRRYVVVLAAGLDTSQGYFDKMKNEIQYRMNTQGDTVDFIDAFPYGEREKENFIKQAGEMFADMGLRRSGGNYINWKLTGANVGENDFIILIGHSAGGVAITDAYGTMDDYHRYKVTEVVSIGSPRTGVPRDADKFTYIYDPRDLIGPPIGGWGNNRPCNVVTVDNYQRESAYYNTNTGDIGKNLKNIKRNAELFSKYLVKVHNSYFDSAEKAAKVLNIFLERAMN